MADGLTEQEIKNMKRDLKRVQKFIEEIENMGGNAPKALKKSLKGLEIAINTGKDLGDAAQEASNALRKFETELRSACNTVPRDRRAVCEARIDRKYLARGVDFTLNFDNPDSATRGFLQRTVQRYTPGLICRNWSYCAGKSN